MLSSTLSLDHTRSEFVVSQRNDQISPRLKCESKSLTNSVLIFYTDEISSLKLDKSSSGKRAHSDPNRYRWVSRRIEIKFRSQLSRRVPGQSTQQMAGSFKSAYIRSLGFPAQ